MSDPGQDRARLKKVIDEPIATLTAVEVDTVARARELIDDLRPGAPDRPSAVVALDARASSPDAVLAQARAATEGFPAAVGVLFVVDTTGGGAQPPVEFWRGLNFLRESWAALGAHVVFFLRPQSYRLLVTEADHFADWVPLRFHFLGAGAAVGAATQDAPAALDFGLLAPEVARQELTRLEAALRRALALGAPPAALTRRYYLPLLRAALSLGDRHRARALVAQVDEGALAESDRPIWWRLAAIHFLEDRDLAAAERVVDRLTADSEARQDERALAAAAEWYRKSLAVFEKLGDEHGAAITFDRLGHLAGLQGAYEESGRWLIRSVKAFQAGHDPHGARRKTNNFVTTYHSADAPTQARLKALWQAAGLGPLPDLPAEGDDAT